MKKHNLITLGVCLCLCAILTSCGNGAKNEKELQKDLLESGEFYNAQEVDIVGFEIEKRLTDKENRRDTVYAIVSVENEDITGTLYYEMDYIQYNDGWNLDSVARYKLPSFSPKSTPSDEMMDDVLEHDLNDRFGEIPYEITDTVRDTSQELSCSTSYQVEVRHTYATLTYSYEVILSFNEELGIWENPGAKQVGEETIEWDIIGEYERTKETTNYIMAGKTVGEEKDMDFGKISFKIKDVQDGNVIFDVSGPGSDGKYQELIDCSMPLVESKSADGEHVLLFDVPLLGVDHLGDSRPRVIEIKYDHVILCTKFFGIASDKYTNEFYRTAE